MDKQNKNNFKKLLCYNIVNEMKCVYKYKCMFAHKIDEQIKEPLREYIHEMIYIMNDLSNINIKENKELFEELMIFTKECKNCMNKKCPGGYNCKFGVCVKNLKVCYNDLLNGKCLSLLNEENIDNKIIKRCIHGIHLTEKNLIPYYQRVSCEINILDVGVFIFNNINYYSKINTVSILLNDDTIKLVKNLITKNKINKNDMISKINYWDKYNVNFFANDNKNNTNNDDNNYDDEYIIKEYQIEKMNDATNGINDYFWRYHQYNFTNPVNTCNIDIDDSNNNKNIYEDEPNINIKIKNIIQNLDENNDLNEMNGSNV
jgi:hypothetical protein